MRKKAEKRRDALGNSTRADASILRKKANARASARKERPSIATSQPLATLPRAPFSSDCSFSSHSTGIKRRCLDIDKRCGRKNKSSRPTERVKKKRNVFFSFFFLPRRKRRNVLTDSLLQQPRRPSSSLASWAIGAARAAAAVSLPSCLARRLEEKEEKHTSRSEREREKESRRWKQKKKNSATQCQDKERARKKKLKE